MNSETTLEPEEKSKAKKLTICPFSTGGGTEEDFAYHCGPQCELYDEADDQCIAWTFLGYLRQLNQDMIKER